MRLRHARRIRAISNWRARSGATLARRGIGVVYGGGRLGLMGAVAERRAARGRRGDRRHSRSAWSSAEVANLDCTELKIVANMHERKQAFTDLSDGFLTMPGGVGTMDELWEAVSWAQLGYHAKPVGLLNAFGFYDGLLEFNRHMAEVGFVRPAHQGIIIAEDELDRAARHGWPRTEPHTPIFQMKAEDL